MKKKINDILYNLAINEGQSLLVDIFLFILAYLVLSPALFFGIEVLFFKEPVTAQLAARCFGMGLGLAAGRGIVWVLEAVIARITTKYHVKKGRSRK